LAGPVTPSDYLCNRFICSSAEEHKCVMQQQKVVLRERACAAPYRAVWVLSSTQRICDIRRCVGAGRSAELSQAGTVFKSALAASHFLNSVLTVCRRNCLSLFDAVIVVTTRRIINLSTRWGKVVSFTLQPLYPQRNSPRHVLNRRR
jgi:hypothetical protein